MEFHWPWQKKAKPTAQKLINDPAWTAEVAKMIVTQSQSGKAEWSSWSGTKAVQEGYKSSTVVYACITALMEAMSSVPWVVYKKNPNAERRSLRGYRVPDLYEPVSSDDPLQRLIDKPNPFFNQQQMIEIECAHLHLAGNSILYKVRVGRKYDPKTGQEIIFDANGKRIELGPPVEIWLLPPDTIAPVPDTTKYISHYSQKLGTTKETKISTSDIVHFQLPDPANLRWGISPLMAGSKAVDTDKEAVNFNKFAMQNRGVHDMVYNFKSDLSDDQWLENTKRIKDSYMGAANAYNPLVLSAPELEIKTIMTNLKDLDFMVGRKFTAVEICMLFRVPPAVCGLFQAGAAQSEANNAQEHFWLNTVIPRLVRIQETLNRQLAPDFGPDYWIGFDVSGVEALSEVFSRKVKTGRELWSMGYPANVVNERLGLNLPSIPGGNEGWVAASYIPISGAGGETLTETPSPEEEVPTEEEAAEE